MSDPPHAITIRLQDFDRSRLKPDQQGLDGVPLRLAIQEYFEREFQSGLGAAEIAVTETEIILRWTSSEAPVSLAEKAVSFLSGGDYARGIALLEIALRGDPDDQNALYNLGMVLSDQGRLDEAEKHLRHLLQLDPDYARGWVALGVALGRKRTAPDAQAAVAALRQAVVCAPDDGYALKNLGGILIADEKTHQEAAEVLHRTAEILPGDQDIWINLGKLHEKAGDLAAADKAYLKVLEINSVSQLAQIAEEGRSRISQQTFRAHGGSELRPDAVMYCLGAIERFSGKTPAEVQKITFEIATLGMNGIDVNDSVEKYSLKSIPGKFSGLHLLCIEYVGFKQLDPSVDIGFDLSKEYAEARRMHSEK